MSLILDALNRADNERKNEQNSPNLHVAPVFSANEAKPYLRWVVEALIAITLIGYIIYLQMSADSTATEQLQPLQATPVISTTQPSTPITIPPVTKDKISTKKPSSEISQLYQQAQAPSVATTHKPHTSPAPLSLSTPEKKPHINTNIPFLTELPPKVQKLIPSIDYNQHVFFENGESFIEVNQILAKQEDYIDDTLQLISIHAEYCIFSYQGYQFRLNALNSWVNFQ